MMSKWTVGIAKFSLFELSTRKGFHCPPNQWEASRLQSLLVSGRVFLPSKIMTDFDRSTSCKKISELTLPIFRVDLRFPGFFLVWHIDQSCQNTISRWWCLKYLFIFTPIWGNDLFLTCACVSNGCLNHQLDLFMSSVWFPLKNRTTLHDCIVPSQDPATQRALEKTAVVHMPRCCDILEDGLPVSKYLGSPPFISHGKVIWKGSHNPILTKT